MKERHPIRKQNIGPPRSADEILRDVTDPKLKKEALGYFNCFRFMKRGEPCQYCLPNQLNVLHCLDSRESECLCSVCCRLSTMIQCCEDYPEEESLSEDYDECSDNYV